MWRPGGEGPQITGIRKVLRRDRNVRVRIEGDHLTIVRVIARVLNSSNPNVIVDGWFHTGIPNQRDNARLLVEIAPTQAQYRPSVGRIFANGFE